MEVRSVEGITKLKVDRIDNNTHLSKHFPPIVRLLYKFNDVSYPRCNVLYSLTDLAEKSVNMAMKQHTSHFFSVLDHMDILLKDKEVAHPTFVSALFIGR